MIVLSVKNFTSVNCNLDSSCTDLAKRFARTAACSSKRGMVSCFIGATLLFAATNVTARVSSSGGGGGWQRGLEPGLHDRPS